MEAVSNRNMKERDNLEYLEVDGILRDSMGVLGQG